MELLIDFLILPLGAYLAGAIPFGPLIARAHGVDLRTVGSGNVGATNVGRVLGARWGALCFLLDVLKGLLPVLAAGLYLRSATAIPPLARQGAWLAVGVGAVVGHIWSIFLKFHGGKGVATSLGVVLGFYPFFTFAGLAAFALWGAAVLVWRYVSLASIVAAGAFPLLFLASARLMGWPVRELWPLLAFAAAVSSLIIVRHRGNIRRLMQGTENRIGGRKGASPAGAAKE